MMLSQDAIHFSEFLQELNLSTGLPKTLMMASDTRFMSSKSL